MTNRIAHTTANGTPLDRIMDDQGRRSQWLARRVGVSESLVRYWRSGERRITERFLPSVAQALGISVEELQS